MKATIDHFKQFDYLISKELPDRLCVTLSRFFPETVFEQYKVYSKRKALRDGVAL